MTQKCKRTMTSPFSNPTRKLTLLLMGHYRVTRFISPFKSAADAADALGACLIATVRGPLSRLAMFGALHRFPTPRWRSTLRPYAKQSSEEASSRYRRAAVPAGRDYQR